MLVRLFAYILVAVTHASTSLSGVEPSTMIFVAEAVKPLSKCDMLKCPVTACQLSM